MKKNHKPKKPIKNPDTEEICITLSLRDFKSLQTIASLQGFTPEKVSTDVLLNFLAKYRHWLQKNTNRKPCFIQGCF